ncbi:MAG: hypothetical protein WC916_00475 [Candidatus Woesearchaeota archaeon]
MFQPNCPGGITAKAYFDSLHKAAVDRWIDVASELPTNYISRIIKDYECSTSKFQKLLNALDLAYAPPYVVAYRYTIANRNHKKHDLPRSY